jgi:hypothetical protein
VGKSDYWIICQRRGITPKLGWDILRLVADELPVQVDFFDPVSGGSVGEVKQRKRDEPQFSVSHNLAE